MIGKEALQNMRLLKFMVPGTILAAGLMLSTTSSYGKMEYSKKEKKSCTFCHVKAGSKELNDAGKYYAAHNHSLEGYKPAK
jgi:hypothetical protein